MNPTVSILKTNYENLDIQLLLEPLGGLKNYVKKGKNVILKVNLLNATEPGRAVVTNPLFVKTIATEIQKIGANPIIADSPSGQFSKGRLKRVYRIERKT